MGGLGCMEHRTQKNTTGATDATVYDILFLMMVSKTCYFTPTWLGEMFQLD